MRKEIILWAVALNYVELSLKIKIRWVAFHLSSKKYLAQS